MPSNCIVPHCRSRRKDYKLFLVPYTDRTRWAAWKTACPFLENLSPIQMQNARFCALHFAPHHINDQNKLSEEAVPALDLFPTVTVPSSSNDQQTGVLQHHSEAVTGSSGMQELSQSIQTSSVNPQFVVRSFDNRHDLVRRVRYQPIEITPRKKILRDNNKVLKAKIRLLKNRYSKLKSKFTQINCPKTAKFIKKYKTLNKFGKMLIDTQLRLTGVSSQGRRYTSEEKIFALSIFKLSPKCYAHLRKYFVLPCKSTFGSMLSNVPLRPGINDFIFQHLADAAIGKSEMEKQCVLLFDEMAICKNLHFNFHTGVIEGFEDLGSGQRSSNVADKALVFMLRGIFINWKLPIAFYFARDGVKTIILKNIVKEIIIAVFKSNFCIRATVSDQGSANVAAINSLRRDTRAELLRSNSNDEDNIYYKINDNIIYHIFDVPHLLKCFRNNFQKKNIILGGQRAKWSFLEKLYKVDGCAGKARSVKLTDKHINPQSYDKMKVKLAAQVFSRQVATSLEIYMKSLLFLQEEHGYAGCETDIENGLFTAELLLFINNLFDSLNSCGYERGKLQQALSSNSDHLSFWNDAVKKLSAMKFDASDARESHPISLKNFIHDITSIKHLWTDLCKLEGIKFLNLRRLNQDPLENFFGQIRAHGGSNTNPDCTHFVSAYKTLLINSITTGKSLYTNCANDDDKMLGTLTNLTQCNREKASYVDSEELVLNCEVVDSIPQENVLQTQSVSYIAGAVCRALLPKLKCVNCSDCKDALLSTELQPFHSLIAKREYDSEKQHLVYPSKNLNSLVWESIYLIDKFLPDNCYVYIYPKLLETLWKNTNTSWFTCSSHKKDFLTTFFLYVIKMQGKQWCINFNRRIHNIDSRPKAAETENLIKKRVTKGLSYRSTRLRSS